MDTMKPEAPEPVTEPSTPTQTIRRRHGRRRRWPAVVVVLLAGLLALNTITVNNQSEGAKRDIGMLMTVPGGEMQWRVDGHNNNAPTLLLIHGLGESMRVWDPMIPILSHHYQVLRVDLLGFGGSSKPTGNHYSIEQQALRVALLLKQLHVRPAAIVGSSLGGLVAVALAEHSPALVTRLVLIDTPPTTTDLQEPLEDKLLRIPVLGQLSWRLAPNAAIRNALKSAFAPGYHVPTRSLNDFRRTTYDSFTKSDDAVHAFLHHAPIPNRLRAMRAPVLVIFGSRDQLISPTSHNAYTSLPLVHLNILDNAGHSPNWEHPTTIAHLIDTTR